jgi:hypothetical protein
VFPALGALVFSFAAQIVVDGDVEDVRLVADASARDAINDVCATARSGFDVARVFVHYAVDLDAVFVGVDLMDIPNIRPLPGHSGVGLPGPGVPGDAGGDGDPDAPIDTAFCVGPPFSDEPGVGPDEFYWVILDPDDGGGLGARVVAQYRDNRLSFVRLPTYEVVPGASGAIALGTLGAAHHPTQIPDENPLTEDIEVRIDHWSLFDATPLHFTVSVVTGMAGGVPNDSVGPIVVDVPAAPCALGTTAHVLRVDGNDVVRIAPRGAPIAVSLDAPPAGPARPRYALWVWASPPTGAFEVAALGSTLGCTVNPTPLSPSAGPQPLRCLRSPGLPIAACGAAAESPAPARAPWTVTRRSGFGAAIVLTLQAAIEDAAAPNALGFGISNAVVLEVE